MPESESSEELGAEEEELGAEETSLDPLEIWENREVEDESEEEEEEEEDIQDSFNQSQVAITETD